MTSELLRGAAARATDAAARATDAAAGTESATDVPGPVDRVSTAVGGSQPSAGATARASVTIDGVPFPIRPHRCFACGSLNVEGLGLGLHVDGDTCWTELSLPDRFEGWEGIAHGGIVCTILDEVMAWSLAARGEWALTARMTVDFKRPVRVGQAIRAEGRRDRARRRLLDTSARLVDATTGELLASAQAVYVVAPDDQKEALMRRYGFALDEAAAAGGSEA